MKLSLPTPDTDPTGLAIAAMVAVTVVGIIDPGEVIPARWRPAVIGGVAILALVLTRLKAWAPATVEEKFGDAGHADWLAIVAICIAVLALLIAADVI